MALPGSQMLTDMSRPQEHLSTFSKGHIDSALDWLDRLHDLAGDDEETQAHFEECVASICAQHTRAQSAKTALQQVAHEYMQADTQTRKTIKLPQKVQNACDEEYEKHPHHDDHKQTAPWAEWCKLRGKQVQEDDDLEIGEGATFMNMKCLVTQKDIFELSEPVEDKSGFIYEKSAVVAMIRRSRDRFITHPARPDLRLTEAELKPSRRVRREAQKRSQVNTQGDDEVL